MTRPRTPHTQRARKRFVHAEATTADEVGAPGRRRDARRAGCRHDREDVDDGGDRRGRCGDDHQGHDLAGEQAPSTRLGSDEESDQAAAVVAGRHDRPDGQGHDAEHVGCGGQPGHEPGRALHLGQRRERHAGRAGRQAAAAGHERDHDRVHQHREQGHEAEPGDQETRLAQSRQLASNRGEHHATFPLAAARPFASSPSTCPVISRKMSSRLSWATTSRLRVMPTALAARLRSAARVAPRGDAEHVVGPGQRPATGCQRGLEAVHVGAMLGRDVDVLAGPLHHLGHRPREDELAEADHDEVVADGLDLRELVRRDDHRATTSPEVAEQLPDLDDPCRVQPIRRLVEDEELRVGEERRGDPEALLHTEREALDRLAIAADQADLRKDRFDAPERQAAEAGERHEVGPGRQAGDERRALDRGPPRARRSRAGVWTDEPRTDALPPEGRIRPSRIRMSVDFPDPFGPTRPMTPAAGSSTVSRSRAVIGPNRRVRSVVVTTDMRCL